MKRNPTPEPRPIAVASTLSVLYFLLSILTSAGDEAKEKLDAPGFQPKSELAQTFLQKAPSSSISVLPTIARTRAGLLHSTTDQKAIISHLTKHNLGKPKRATSKIQLGEPKGKFQFDLFNQDLKTIGAAVKELGGADYFIVIEHLVTPTPKGEIAIGGIHVFVLNAKGENAFSFLLNSHHKIFVDANLRTSKTGDEGHDFLTAKGTAVALSALTAQIRSAKSKTASEEE